MSQQSVIAVDLGATSGRVVLATFVEGRVSLDEVHRFSTAARQSDDGLRLDVAALFDEIQAGIGRAMEAAPHGVAALGIDCWAVDYGLIGDDGLLELPFNYRDPRTETGRALVRERISEAELYSRVGLQDVPFNTVNQLADDLASGRLERATRFLMLLGYWLTGREVAERTNASTTALLDPRTGQWDWELIDRLGLPPPHLRRRGGARHHRRSDHDGPGGGGAAGGRRLARHGLRRRRRAPPGRRRVHLLRYVVPGGDGVGRAHPHGGVAAGEPHQRGWRGRHRPLPQERHGALDPLRGGPALGRRGPRVRRTGPGRGRARRDGRAPFRRDPPQPSPSRRHGQPRQDAGRRRRAAGGPRGVHPRAHRIARRRLRRRRGGTGRDHRTHPPVASSWWAGAP